MFLSLLFLQKHINPPTSEKNLVARIEKIKKENPQNIMAQSFDRAYYESLTPALRKRLIQCCMSGIKNPGSEMGCYACQPNDYEDLKPFFQKTLEMYHKVDLSRVKHQNNWDLASVEGLPSSGELNLHHLGLPDLSMRVRTGRNLKKYPLPGSMSKADRVNLERDMGKAFDKLIADPNFGGQYYSLTPGHPCWIDSKKYQELVNSHKMFKDMSADSFLLDAGIAKHWPHGRGCYVSGDGNFIIWVGEEDHLRIMAMQKGNILNAVFDRLKNAIGVVEQLIDGGCAYHPEFGVVTSCPTNIGTGMRASVHIQLPNLTKDGTDKQAKAIAKPLGLSVRGKGGEHTPIGADGTVDISPSSRFCITEAQILAALYKGIALLKQKEDEAGGLSDHHHHHH